MLSNCITTTDERIYHKLPVSFSPTRLSQVMKNQGTFPSATS